MSQKSSNREFRLEIVKIVLLVIAGGCGLYRYYDTTANEFQKPLWSKETELLFEISEVVATIACTTKPAELEEPTLRFWTLYYGPLCIVENAKLMESMKSFGTALAKGQNHPTNNLKTLSLEIAKACREQVVDLVKAKGEFLVDDKDIPVFTKG